jgi:hypothetical protein
VGCCDGDWEGVGGFVELRLIRFTFSRLLTWMIWW